MTPAPKKILSQKDKTATKGYSARLAVSIRHALKYMKNLKVFPEIHHRLKMEAAARQVHVYDLTAAAITVGLAHERELERVLKQQAESAASTTQAPSPRTAKSS